MKLLPNIALILAITPNESSRAAEPSPTFEASASVELATHMLHMEIRDDRTISKTVKGFFITGNQHTQGPAHVTFLPNNATAEIQLNFDLKTNSEMLATSNVGHGIQVEIETSAQTKTNARKAFQFTPEKFTSIDGQCDAETSLNLNSVSATAPGITRLGRRIKSDIATKKTVDEFDKSKSDQEEKISQETARGICDRINDRTNKLIENLHADFREIVFEPLFEQHQDGNNLIFSTSADRIFATGTTGSKQSNQSQHPESNESDLSILLHQDIFNHFATIDLAGRSFDEPELQAVLRRNGITTEKSGQTPLADELVLKFCRQNPIDYRFESNQIRVNLCASSIRLYEKDFGGATFSMLYHLRPTEKGALEIARLNDVTMHLEPGNTASERERETISGRYDRLFPRKFEIGRVSLPTVKNPDGGLRFTEAMTSAGWLTVKMMLTGADLISQTTSGWQRSP